MSAAGWLSAGWMLDKFIQIIIIIQIVKTRFCHDSPDNKRFQANFFTPTPA
jgi:hypothetical protein